MKTFYRVTMWILSNVLHWQLWIVLAASGFNGNCVYADVPFDTAAVCVAIPQNTANCLSTANIGAHNFETSTVWNFS